MYKRIYVVKRTKTFNYFLCYYNINTCRLALAYIQVISRSGSYRFCQHSAIELTHGSINQCYFLSNSYYENVSQIEIESQLI